MAFLLEDPRPGVAMQALLDIEDNHRTSILPPLYESRRRRRALLFLFDIEDNHRTSILPPIHENRRRRRALLHFILTARRSCHLHPRMTYLAINYADRLIHSNRFPEVEHISLVAIACLSLASEYSDSSPGYFLINNLREEDGFIYFPRHRRLTVELQVMDALNQDMNSITPFAFLHFFLSCYFPSPLSFQNFCDLKVRASLIVVQMQMDNDESVLGYKPSEIAAAALFCSAKQMFPLEFDRFVHAVEISGLVNQGDLEFCYYEMYQVLRM